MQEVNSKVNFKEKSKLIHKQREKKERVLSPSDPIILLTMKEMSVVPTCNLSELFLLFQISAPKANFLPHAA